MPRPRLFEFEDLAWFPPTLRNMTTDYLQLMYRTTGVFSPTIPLLKRALAATGTRRLIDLCSGAGGPLPTLQEQLKSEGVDVEVLLTDKYPNVAAFLRLAAEPGRRISFLEQSVDAADVPADLSGFRTLFTGFHHLPPELARRVLADAVAKREAIGVFEVNERRLIAFLFSLLTPIFVLAVTPRIRPRSGWRFLWTYAIPLVPLCTMWDGLVSNWRTYSVVELKEMTAGLAAGAYSWEIGWIAARAGRRITYLIGLPTPASELPVSGGDT